MEQNTIDSPQLRKFGLILSIGLMGIFGLFIPQVKGNAYPLWPYLIAGFILIPTIIQPLWLKFIYHPWMKLGNILGWINTRIILGIIFYFILTPMGILMRARGKDPMCRTFDKTKASYRKNVSVLPHENMEKPF